MSLTLPGASEVATILGLGRHRSDGDAYVSSYKPKPKRDWARAAEILLERAPTRDGF